MGWTDTIRHWRALQAFRRLPEPARRLVFYAESGQDWHHWAPVIGHLVGPLGQPLCYVSSDPADPGLHQGHPSIRPFCIGQGLPLIWWFQFLRAGVLVTQMLDLHNLHLKRSVHPVHYVYMFHSLISTHMADRASSFDHYDTILCAGPHQAAEIRAREALHGLPAKRLVEHGYHRLEQLLATRREPPPPESAGLHVLLAPSWGERTILPACGDRLVELLLGAGFRVTLRPHFQTRWMTPEVIDRIASRWRAEPRFRLVEQMGESDSLYDSHVMITDWSGAAHDYALGLEKPVLFIDVPPKSRNDSWRELGIEPFEMQVRSRLGALLAPERIEQAPALVRELAGGQAAFRAAIESLRRDAVFNLGRSGPAAAEAIAAILAAIPAAPLAARRGAT